MENVLINEFKINMELQGVYLDKQKKLNMGFSYQNQTFKQKTSFKTMNNSQIFFEHEGVIHLNQNNSKKPCVFCQKNPVHLSTCVTMSESELQNIVIEESMQKIEQTA